MRPSFIIFSSTMIHSLTSGPDNAESSMPPVGGEPVFPHFEPKVKKVRVRRKKRTQNGAQEARTGEGAIVETDTADAGLQT